MITLFFFAVFIARLIYLDYSRPSKISQKQQFRFAVPFVLIAIVLGPILIVNLLQVPGRPMTNEEIIQEAKDSPFDSDLREAFAYVMKKEPKNLPLRFSFIEETSERYIVDDREEGLKKFIFSEDSITQRQSMDYVYARYFPLDSARVLPLKNGSFTHYISGVGYANSGQPEKAYSSFSTSLLTEETTESMQIEFFRFVHFFPELKDKLATNSEVINELPLPYQKYVYYNTGQVFPYLGTIVKATFKRPVFIALLAALVISICWLVFIRSLDIFRKERWIDVIIVFLLGGFFTHFCWIGYDYARYTWEFQINGDFLNDFVYCVGVIGVGEEIVKLIPWIGFIFLAKKAKEPYDYLLYASVSALGFAFVENFSYLEEPGNISVRAIMSTVMHMFAASLVAYGFILGRYSAKSKEWKIIYPILGFIAAAFAHGFYDFWLISPAAKSLDIITTMFFIATTAIWFKMINNAMNNSPYYVARNFNPKYQLHILSIGLITVMASEYLILYHEFGTQSANNLLNYRGWMIPLFLSFVSLLLFEFEVAKGRWRKFEYKFFSWIPGMKSRTDEFGEDAVDNSEFEGLELRLFVPKSNRFVGSKFPVRARCVGLIHVSGSENWCLFQLNSPFDYPGHRKDYVILRTKEQHARLDQDKVEVLLLFIPQSIKLDGTPLHTHELRFTGKAFSRPVS